MNYGKLLLACSLLVSAATHAAENPPNDFLVERGRYLVKVAGCNDCHTAGYRQKNGQIAETQWLLGDTTGWRGAWGTTYATNLRLYAEPLNEEQWLTLARHKPSRPPMPWYALRDMSDDDLRALYRYLRHLGPAGSSVPGYVPPGQEPVTAYWLLTAPGTTQSPAAETKPQTVEEKKRFLDFKPAVPRMERP